LGAILLNCGPVKISIIFIFVLFQISVLGQSKIDSLILYTPIQRSLNPDEIDTVFSLVYTEALREFKEPRIYQASNNNIYLRLIWFRDSLPVMYRIEKDDSIRVICKISNGAYNHIRSIKTQDTVIITKRELDKLEKLINKSKLRTFCSYRTSFRSIQIEDLFDKKYHYNCFEYLDLSTTKDKRQVQSCFNYLNKLFKKN